VTSIGRPEAGRPGVNLELPTISRQHARIVREGQGAATTYFLENQRGRAGVRLYELLLRPGDPRHVLCHGYSFQIPGGLESPAEPHFQLTFCMDAQRTSCLAIMFGQRPTVSIFGQIVRFTPQEYALLAYLYAHGGQLCPFPEIIAHIWATKSRDPEQIRAYLAQLNGDRDALSYKREALDILVAKVRGKIRRASGGVTLIETVRGAGFCLRAARVSGCSKDF
jgi:DNA-binding winged helix-turn-helix (wHTH) protein